MALDNIAYKTILNIAKNPEEETKKFMDELNIKNFFGDRWDNHYKEFLQIDFEEPVILREINPEKKRIVLHYGKNELGRIYYRKSFDVCSVVVALIQSNDKESWNIASILESKRPKEIYSSYVPGRTGSLAAKQYKDITDFLERNCKEESSSLHYSGDNSFFIIRGKKDFALPNNFNKIEKKDLLNCLDKYDLASSYVKNNKNYDDVTKHKLLILLNLKKKECKNYLKHFRLDKRIMNLFSRLK